MSFVVNLRRVGATLNQTNANLILSHNQRVSAPCRLHTRLLASSVINAAALFHDIPAAGYSHIPLPQVMHIYELFEGNLPVVGRV